MRIAIQNRRKTIMASEAADKKFKWISELVEQLINSLKEYKVNMTFNNRDFNADKPKQYEEIRVMMARKNIEDVDLFGLEKTTIITNDMCEQDRSNIIAAIKIEKGRIKKGYNRVMERTKKIRQAFSSAVLSGSRSGSGKLIVEYDELVSIYGGSTSTQPLRFGCQSVNVTNFGFSTDSSHDENETISTGGMSTSSNTEDVNDENLECEVMQTPVLNKGKQKRPHAKDPFQLIDDKRQHLEKSLSLSARQRD
ncbi:uncharacterized protein LOC130614081 [Hydractinia symbiolongicarpus]|uniref:uncharacterized protein LOC130614081 n=1 Tax=Hydractinia symbiolongicarpus TaxID=13093 RepID=UPI0025503D32|nr:uncharacterized protein LOC130614081 [Hydractinia symbiolongicarpus]